MRLRRRGVGLGELLELRERRAGVLDERSSVPRAEELHEGAVVPQSWSSTVLFGKAVPEGMALGPVVTDNRARVVDLVGERDAQRRLVGDVGQMRNVARLALAPGAGVLAVEAVGAPL